MLVRWLVVLLKSTVSLNTYVWMSLSNIPCQSVHIYLLTCMLSLSNDIFCGQFQQHWQNTIWLHLFWLQVVTQRLSQTLTTADSDQANSYITFFRVANVVWSLFLQPVILHTVCTHKSDWQVHGLRCLCIYIVM